MVEVQLQFSPLVELEDYNFIIFTWMIKIVFTSLGCLMLFSSKYLSGCNELIFK